MPQARTIKAVFDLLIDALQADETLSSWCNTNYACQPDIQCGVDDDDLPEMTSKLAIRIIPGSRSRTRGMAYRSHSLIIRGIIKDSGARVPDIIPEPDPDEVPDPEAPPPPVQETGWKTLKALENIDAFISMIEAIVINAIQDDGIAITPEYGAPDQIIYPYARAELAYTIEIPSEI